MQKIIFPRNLLGVIRPSSRYLCLRRELSTAPPATQYSGRAKHGKVSTDTSDPDYPLYNYTSGRWLFNEYLRLPERRLIFNINGLRQVVAKAVSQSTDALTDLVKIAEGGSFRIIEASFRDGRKAIVRLPYPCTIPHKYGVASEVATMEFLRLHGIPTPKVLDWDSSVSNDIGSEYIIMERAPGKELENTWYTMTPQERMAAVEKVVDIEKLLFSIQFPASGSLYYKDSLGPDIKKVDIAPNTKLGVTDKFCVGPSTEFLWWYQKRDELTVNRGPWKSSDEVLQAVGQRELMWLQKFGEKRFPREFLYREYYGDEKVNPEVQIANLLDYLKIAPHIVPDGKELNLPTIRHPDLSPNNIFVSESGDITGIIDWQHCTILPMFLQAKIPKHFQNYGDDDSENFRPPKLPEGFNLLTESQKEQETELYRRRQLHYFYLGFTSHNNESHFNAMETYDLVVRTKLYDTAGKPWEGDNTSLKAELIHASTYWPAIACSPMKQTEFPVHYSDAEVKECLDINDKQKEADTKMQKLRDCFGINIDGWVSTDLYDGAIEKSQNIKHYMMDATETEAERKEVDDNWPFQDHEELD